MNPDKEIEIAKNGTDRQKLKLLKSITGDNAYLLALLSQYGTSGVHQAVLEHPRVTESIPRRPGTLFNTTALHELADEGGYSTLLEVMKHPMVSKVLDSNNRTPLHILAKDLTLLLKTNLLRHPDIVTVKDKNGFTPLHVAADQYLMPQIQKKMLKNPFIDSVHSNDGLSPLDVMMHHGSKLAEEYHNKKMKEETSKIDESELREKFKKLVVSYELPVKDYDEFITTRDGTDGQKLKLLDGLTEDNMWLLIPLAETASKELQHAILKHPSVGQLFSRRPESTLMTSALHALADFGDRSTLLLMMKHPLISRVFDSIGKTPLHILAEHVRHLPEVIDHPDIDKVHDKSGFTPLHVIADRQLTEDMQKKVLMNPQVDKLKSKRGYTPIDLLINGGSKLAEQYYDRLMKKSEKHNFDNESELREKFKKLIKE